MDPLDKNIATGSNIANILQILLGKKGSTESVTTTTGGGTETKQTMVNAADIMTQILGATGKYYGGATLSDVAAQKKRAGLYGGSSGMTEQRFLTQAATEAAVAAAPTVATKPSTTIDVKTTGKGSQAAAVSGNNLALLAALGLATPYGRKKAKELWDTLSGVDEGDAANTAAWESIPADLRGISPGDYDFGGGDASQIPISSIFRSVDSFGGDGVPDVLSAIDSWMTPAGGYSGDLTDATQFASSASATDFGASAWDAGSGANALADSWGGMTDAFGGADVAADAWTSGYDLPMGDMASSAADIGMPGIGSMFNLATGNNAGGGAGESAVLSMIPVVGPALSLVNALGDNPVSDIVDTAGDVVSDIGNSIGCFITTATLQALGEDTGDDSPQLNTLRHYRDTWLTANHPEDIKEYYRIAPQVVEAINQRDDSRQIYMNLWRGFLSPALTLIGQGKNEEAYQQYRAMVTVALAWSEK